jgi:hypothetical protein
VEKSCRAWGKPHANLRHRTKLSLKEGIYSMHGKVLYRIDPLTTILSFIWDVLLI